MNKLKLFECTLPFVVAVAAILCISAGEDMGASVLISSLALYAAKAKMEVEHEHERT